MALILNDEEKMLKSSASEFLSINAPVEQFRSLRDNNYQAYNQDVWQEIIAMGWTALTFPEQYNGLDFGYVGMGQVMEEMGRKLTKSPLFSSIILCGTALVESTNQSLKEKWIPELMDGTKRIAFAQDEKSYFDPTIIEATAVKCEGGFKINGQKQMIIDGTTADAFIVVAKTEEEKIEFFLIDANATGLEVKTDILLDAGSYANIQLKEVMVENSNHLTTVEKASDVLKKINHTAAICLSAEMLGLIKEAFDQTIAYLQERQQFGKRIGSYQALQHRAAKMFCEIELCKSIVIKALQGLDNNVKNLDELASLAKAKLGITIKEVTNEAMQMHGGIGVTDDVNVGFYFKRARVLQRLFGDYNYHLDRYAGLKGY